MTLSFHSRALGWCHRVCLFVSLMALAATAPLSAQSVTVSRWLVLGPIPIHVPFGAANADSSLLDATRIRVAAWPSEGTALSVPNAGSLLWRPGPFTVNGGQSVYAATYLAADRWQHVTLEFRGGSPEGRRVWLDGARLAATQADLAQGKHLVVVQQVVADGQPPATIEVTVTSTTNGATPAATLDPRRPGTWADFHNVAAVTAIRMDPKAKQVAYVLRRNDEDNDRATSSLVVREVASSRLIEEISAGEPASPEWSADGLRMAYVAASDKKDSPGRDLMLWNSTTNERTRLLRGESIVQIVGWAKDGRTIYYTGMARAPSVAPAKPGEARRLTEVWQRFDAAPEKLQIFAVSVADGSRTTLVGDSTFGVAGVALSPDGRSIAFSRSAHNHDAPPWIHAELWTLDVESLAAKRILTLEKEVFNAPSTFAWSPDSKAVAFCGSAKELLKGEDPNFSVYESELYATNVDHPALVHLSSGFVPSVGVLGCPTLTWNAADGRIYVSVEAGAKTVPARTRRAVTSALESTTLETMAMPAEVVSAFDAEGSTMIAAVEGPTSPPALHRIDLTSGNAAPFAQPNDGALAGVDVPQWHPWTFRNSRGEDIEAWFWTPPGFDSTKAYPMLVHYYGGTLAMKKNFEQRLLWFASNGYLVLFMNPAGAPGYGQKFSNYHVNDWGYPAASDIIEGTQQFIQSHKYVEGARVANFGHSYGGFMTMHVLTRTKIFRTGIALAGIANIANYWGAGGSGYSYTDGTCPACYPWNRKDIYVDRSPLFSADKITAPLLLIHGTDDTNVVPTESEQMFTALRMLGREAELVRVKGENHGIDSRPSVAFTRDRIMLDWFDKYLKDRPAAWAARWGAGGVMKLAPSGP